MKEYTLKFGMYYKMNIWHVIHKTGNRLASDCDSQIFMGLTDLTVTMEYYIYPIAVKNRKYGDTYNTDYNLSYNRICPTCKKKFQLTKKDINHYIVLAKLGIKI